MANLTDATAKASKPARVARDLADGTIPGLSLRVMPSGAKAWALRATLGGRRVRIDLGIYPHVTVKAARIAASKAIGTIERGDDPRYEGCTVAEAVTEWLASKTNDNTTRSLANEKRLFEIHVLPTIGTAGIRSIKPEVLSALLRRIAAGGKGARPKPVAANRTYGSMRALFRWCRRNMGCPTDPTELIDKPTKEEPSARRRRQESEHILDMSELAALWSVAPTLPGSVLGDLLRCLLLVPLRREEWTGLRWQEVREAAISDGWTGAALVIPAMRMKGGRPATVPLPAAAVEILEARRAITGRGEFVFSVPGATSAYAGWKRGADTLRNAHGERTDWSPHTIRKSVATAMARDLGADDLLISRILQHSVKSVLGVTHVYQRSQRLAEQATLMTKWSEHLQAVAATVIAQDGVGKRVVKLRAVLA